MAIDSRARVDVAELYSRHRLALVRMAVLLVDGTAAAEDVVHDAFLQLHRRQDTLRDPDAALGYLRRSVVNGCHSALRRRRTARDHLKVAEPDLVDGADTAALLADEHREVLTFVRRLPPREQQVLVLRYWSDLSEAEIAETLGIARGTVKSTAARALDKLESMLEAAR